jgi:two-component system sensor histidine kinase QseC
MKHSKAQMNRALPPLWRHLWFWTLGALLVVWLTLISVAWYTGHHEAGEITDGQLVAASRLWLHGAKDASPAEPVPLNLPPAEAYVLELAVLQWEGSKLVTDTHGLAAGLGLARPAELGMFTVTHQGPAGPVDWRMYVGETADGARRVAMLMDMDRRYDLGRDVAQHVARPALLVLPLVALMLWWAIRRGLRPLDRLSSDVAMLDGFAGERLDTQHRFREFSSTVAAINTLVDTLQTRAQREREFASDVAHEMRTPLAAIALQSRAAQQEATPEHLQRLEQEALRAGRILSQLLDLARAHRVGVVDPGHGGEWVDVGELAASLIAAHAQQAYDSEHEIALVKPDAPVQVSTPAMLVELALRNLIENSLRHTPPGTQVEVVVWRAAGAVGVSVSDDGQRPGAALKVVQSSAGLGLGLRLVQRIAEQMGAVLERDGAVAPMTTRFTLRWDAPNPDH